MLRMFSAFFALFAMLSLLVHLTEITAFFGGTAAILLALDFALPYLVKGPREVRLRDSIL
ncbi:MAG TPA: hypothetical protein VKQ11_20455 [Candidatus Sulfotelmatobacter sp.]|nr:hypothetical protein [Candidatus Sulfotelmatobacter sp.]